MTFREQLGDGQNLADKSDISGGQRMKPQNRAKAGRTTDGRFRKGVSGNPGGRPKIENAKELREALQLLAPRALDVLREIMEDQDSSASARLAAAQAILDRCFGKPTQAIDSTPGDAFCYEDAVKRLEEMKSRSQEEEAPQTRDQWGGLRSPA